MGLSGEEEGSKYGAEGSCAETDCGVSEALSARYRVVTVWAIFLDNFHDSYDGRYLAT